MLAGFPKKSLNFPKFVYGVKWPTEGESTIPEITKHHSEAMMSYKDEFIPSQITEQVSQACAVIERHLASTLQAIHLYGSALDGGLKPYSDIDLLATVSARPDEAIRQALLLDLLTVSTQPGKEETLRALEVTVIVHNEVRPWRYPAKIN